jgi:hypothetical protein
VGGVPRATGECLPHPLEPPCGRRPRRYRKRPVGLAAAAAGAGEAHGQEGAGGVAGIRGALRGCPSGRGGRREPLMAFGVFRSGADSPSLTAGGLVVAGVRNPAVRKGGALRATGRVSVLRRSSASGVPPPGSRLVS